MNFWRLYGGHGRDQASCGLSSWQLLVSFAMKLPFAVHMPTSLRSLSSFNWIHAQRHAVAEWLDVGENLPTSPRASSLTVGQRYGLMVILWIYPLWCYMSFRCLHFFRLVSVAFSSVCHVYFLFFQEQSSMFWKKIFLLNEWSWRLLQSCAREICIT